MHASLEESLDLQNRRCAKRFILDLPLTTAGRKGRTLNISATGVRFVAPGLKEQEELSMTLELGGETIVLNGETVWSQTVGNSRVVGASFKPSKDLYKLCRYLYPVA